jgi:hypothetical protein
VVTRDPALLRIKFCQLDGLRNILIEDNDCGRREWPLGRREGGGQGKTGE